MRPRGLSRSSPSSWYVGQVAVQKPQCTHERRIASASRPSWVSLYSGARFVCMALLYEAAEVEHGVGVEHGLQLAMDLRQCGVERVEGARCLVVGAEQR